MTSLAATRERPKTHKDIGCQITKAQGAATHLSASGNEKSQPEAFKPL